MKTVKTFTAIIYVGFKEMDTGIVHTIGEARDICQRYVDEVGLCVTVTPTEYIYTNGNEPGCAIGLINYPRFPAEEADIAIKSRELARLLMDAFRQNKVSVVMPDRTIMLEVQP